MHSAQALLSAGPFQRLLFELGGWIENGEWLARKLGAEDDQPLAPFADRVLSRRQRKMRQHESLAEMPDTTRHRLRIDAKKLRYAGEFFASLFRDKASVKHRQAFSRALERLQDSLGELNDMVVVAAGRNALFENLEPITAARLKAQFEALLKVRSKSHRKLLKQAQRSLTNVADASAWWKTS
jgi:CHAD domain-containing protein